jgi:hypothetical protein
VILRSPNTSLALGEDLGAALAADAAARLGDPATLEAGFGVQGMILDELSGELRIRVEEVWRDDSRGVKSEGLVAALLALDVREGRRVAVLYSRHRWLAVEVLEVVTDGGDIVLRLGRTLDHRRSG